MRKHLFSGLFVIATIGMLMPLAVQCLSLCEQSACTRHSRAVAFTLRNSQTLPADDFARRALMESRVSVGFADRHEPVDQFPITD